MRARYSAYCQSNITYIQNTMRGKAAVDFNAKKIKGWSLSVEWLGLKIIKSFFSDDPSVAYVEFVARYRERNKIKIIHERSEFRCIGFWYYTDGVHLPTTEMEK
jgi:SEC-C motif domain protein